METYPNSHIRQHCSGSGSGRDSSNPTVIYCAGGNFRLIEIAYAAGWELGVRSDKYHYATGWDDLTFVDVDYKQPDFELHMRRVALEKPYYCTVPDLSEEQVDDDDLNRAMRQYQRLSDYCPVVYIVPKLSGQIELLPSDVPIAYSVPTSYGGAQYPLWELTGRRVHLLGGSPHEQLRIAKYVRAIADLLSVDGNMHQKMAIEFCKYWKAGGREGGRWLSYPEKGKDFYFDAFRLSSENIIREWRS